MHNVIQLELVCYNKLSQKVKVHPYSPVLSSTHPGERDAAHEPILAQDIDH